MKPIAKDISNKGYFNWVIPNLKTINCIFKVESSVEPNTFISEYSMKITEKHLLSLKIILMIKDILRLTP